MLSVASLVVFCLVVAAGSLAQEEWVDQEIDLVKEEATEIQKLSSNMVLKLDRLDRYGLLAEYVKPRRAETQAKVTVVTYPRSCIEYYDMGDMRTGWKTIDPYQNQQYFSVRCDYDGNDIITEFGFGMGATEDEWSDLHSGPLNCENQPHFSVPGYSDFCYGTSKSVPYKLTDSQISAALTVSGQCSQRVMWDCLSNSLLYLQDYSGNTTMYGKALTRGSSTLQQGICECGMRSPRMCHLCHCGADKPRSWKTDDILIQGKSRLPVKALFLGDLAGANERAQITIKPIKCTSPMSY